MNKDMKTNIKVKLHIPYSNKHKAVCVNRRDVDLNLYRWNEIIIERFMQKDNKLVFLLTLFKIKHIHRLLSFRSIWNVVNGVKRSWKDNKEK